MVVQLLPVNALCTDPNLCHTAVSKSPSNTEKARTRQKQDSPLRTANPQRHTPTPHIADLRLRARRTRTIRAHHATLPLVRIMQAHQTGILLHRFRDKVPERRVQRRTVRPAEGVVGGAGVVFVAPDGAGEGGVEGREGGDVGVVGGGVVDVEVAGVDDVHAVAGVEVGERGDGRADPGGGEGRGRGLGGAVVGVVDHEFVFVRVAEEDVGDDVGRVAVDDLVEEVAGVGERVGAVPAGEDVAEDPDAFVGVFGGLEFRDQEGEHAAVVGVGGVDEVEEVGLVDEVCV